MKIKCLLVDDEPLAITLLQNHIKQLDNVEVVATCNNVAKAYEILHVAEINLLFLDIKMPKLSGIEFLKTLQNPPRTILTTAYRDYAMEGYDLGVIDYLLKPVSFDRLLRSIDRFWKLYAPTLPANTVSAEHWLVIKSGYKYLRIFTGDIYYIESLKECVKIYTAEKEFVAKYKISDLEAEMSNKGFLRIHRSFIINVKKVTAFSGEGIELGKFEIPVGASYKELIKRTLKFE